MSITDRILLVSWGRGNGHVTRLLSIGAALSTTGAKCVVLTHNDGIHADLIERAGYGAVNYPDWADKADPWTRWGDERFLKQSIEYDLRVIEDCGPHLVVNDNRISTIIACAIADIPVVTLCQDNQIPGHTYAKEDLAPIWTEPIPAVNKQLVKNGLTPIADDLRWIFALGRIAIPSEAEYEPVDSKSTALDIVHLGALSTIPAIGRKEQNDLLFYRTVDHIGTEFLESFEAWDGQLFVATGDKDRLKSISRPNLPSNVKIAPLWDLGDIGGGIRAIVHHGGHGISTTGIASGIPAVVLPGANPERRANGDRAAALGLATVLLPDTFAGPVWGPAVDVTRDRPDWAEVQSAVSRLPLRSSDKAMGTTDSSTLRIVEALL